MVFSCPGIPKTTESTKVLLHQQYCNTWFIHIIQNLPEHILPQNIPMNFFCVSNLYIGSGLKAIQDFSFKQNWRFCISDLKNQQQCFLLHQHNTRRSFIFRMKWVPLWWLQSRKAKYPKKIYLGTSCTYVKK